MSFDSCIEKQNQIKELFTSCSNKEARYERIIELGRDLGKLQPKDRTAEALVRGCQSEMYLASHCKDGKLYFEAESDALISAGLALLLVRVYDGEPPEALIKCPPTYLEELGIPESLTPGRAIGLASLHRTMVQHAVKAIAKATNS